MAARSALRLATLLDASLLAAQVAQVVKLRAADAAPPDELDAGHLRAEQGKDTLDALAVRDLAHDEG